MSIRKEVKSKTSSKTYKIYITPHPFINQYPLHTTAAICIICVRQLHFYSSINYPVSSKNFPIVDFLQIELQ